MRIGILAPIATADVAHLLENAGDNIPPGFPGAPFMATLIETFLHQGHEVVAFTSDRTLDPNGKACVVEGPGFRLWLCPARSNSTLPSASHPVGRIWDFFRLERQQLARAVAQESMDILHAHWTYEFAMVAAESGRPCLATIHDAPGDVLRLAPGPYALGRYFMAQKVFGMDIPITAVSPYVAKVVERRSRQLPIPLIANPLPPWLKALADLAPSSQAIAPDSVVAMVLGYWTRFKNPMPGIRAFANLAREFDEPVELRLYGSDFAPGGKAEHEIRRAGIPMHNIRLRGRLEHKALLEEISNASVLLHPSLTESFGMAVAEAMALGVPVIAGCDSGAMPWLLQHGAAGQLVNVRHSDAIRPALHKALTGSAEISAQAKQAQDTIWELTDADAVARRYVSAYRETLQ